MHMSAFRMRSLCPGSFFFYPGSGSYFFYFLALISGTGYARQIRIQVCRPYFTAEFGLLIVYGSGFFFLSGSETFLCCILNIDFWASECLALGGFSRLVLDPLILLLDPHPHISFGIRTDQNAAALHIKHKFLCEKRSSLLNLNLKAFNFFFFKKNALFLSFLIKVKQQYKGLDTKKGFRL